MQVKTPPEQTKEQLQGGSETLICVKAWVQQKLEQAQQEHQRSGEKDESLTSQQIEIRHVEEIIDEAIDTLCPLVEEYDQTRELDQEEGHSIEFAGPFKTAEQLLK